MAGKAKRLNKAAKEYNVSISTIVDFLATKGFEIDSKPNTKIEGEVLGALESEFAADKTAKEKSKQASVTREKRESISLKDMKSQEEVPEVKETFKEFDVNKFKEGTPVAKEKTAAPVEPEKVPVPEKEQEKPAAVEKTVVEQKPVEKEIIGEGDVKVAVVGKIDLSTINQKN
jgi:translation initiation factor IF-2